MEGKDVWAAGDLYEPYVGRWSRLVAREFLSWLSVPAEMDWLDVGCGTGALTQVILETAMPHAVRGVDPSAGFIEYAKSRITGPLASFEVGDAQSLPVDPGSFDVAVAGLVLNFVPEPSSRRRGDDSCGPAWGCRGRLRLGLRRKDGADALLLGCGCGARSGGS